MKMARPSTSSGLAPAHRTATDPNAYAPTGSAGRGFAVFVWHQAGFAFEAEWKFHYFYSAAINDPIPAAVKKL
jgi:hypothetical protein